MARTKEAVQAAIEARQLRDRAFKARLSAMKAGQAAERAEARAQLLLQGTPPDDVDRHIQVLEAEHARYLEAYGTGSRTRRGVSHRPPAGQAVTALERLLRASGRTPEEATEEAETRMKAVDEARKRFEEFTKERERLERSLEKARQDLEEIERAREEIENRRPRSRPPYRGGQGRVDDDLRSSLLDRRLGQLTSELEKAEAEHREDDVKRLRAEIQELMRDAELRAAHRDGRGPRGRNGLEARVDRIESEVREIRRLVEMLIEKK